MGLVVKDDGWRRPDDLWARIEPLLPQPKPHPQGCPNPRVPARRAMEAILFLLRTECLGNSLNVTGICSPSSTHRRFTVGTQAGVFERLWALGLQQ